MTDTDKVCCDCGKRIHKLHLFCGDCHRKRCDGEITMDKTAALHRCELCGETGGEEELGGYVEENGPYCMYCFDIAVEIAKTTAWLTDTNLTETINELRKEENTCALCGIGFNARGSYGWLADKEFGGPLCRVCSGLDQESMTEAIDVIRKEKKELAQDNMRYTWSSNSRA